MRNTTQVGTHNKDTRTRELPLVFNYSGTLDLRVITLDCDNIPTGDHETLELEGVWLYVAKSVALNGQGEHVETRYQSPTRFDWHRNNRIYTQQVRNRGQGMFFPVTEVPEDLRRKDYTLEYMPVPLPR